MFFYKWVNENKYQILTCFILILTFLYSFYFYTFVHDPHHHGLMMSNALDLAYGRKPYEEIFIQYGILTTIFHSIVIKTLGQQIYYLNAFTILIYSVTLFFIYKTAFRITNSFYAFFCVFLLLANHPVIWLPWPNYIAYFFLVLGTYFFFKNPLQDGFFIGVIYSFCFFSRQEFFLPIFFSIIFLSILNYFIHKKFFFKMLLGFLTPILFFFIYLTFSGTFLEWHKTLSLPKLYLELFNKNLFELIYSFIIFFSTDVLFNFINKPQYLLILVILISSLFSFFISFKDKNIPILFLSVLSIFLCIVSLNLELFRFYTSVSLGVILIAYLLFQSKDYEIKNISLIFLVLTSFFSFFFYPAGNYHVFKKKKNYVTSDIPFLKYTKLSIDDSNYYKNLVKIKNQITSNCQIKYFENLTFNTVNSFMLGTNRLKLKPFVKSDSKNTRVETFFDSTFVKKINKQFLFNDIVLLVSDENLFFTIGNIKIPSNYSYFELNTKGAHDKPKIDKLFFPSNCLS